MFLAEHPNAPFDIRITYRFLEPWEKHCLHCIKQMDVNAIVIMKKYIRPEEKNDLVVEVELDDDGIGLVHKKTLYIAA